jgi:hypothetical protein
MNQATSLARKFDLDSSIILPGSSTSVELNLATDNDVVQAIASASPFPKRPDGKIELGHVSFKGDVKFKADTKQTGATSVGFAFSGSTSAGAGVYDQARDAIAALGLAETPQLDLSVPDDSQTRFFLLRTGYQTFGSVEASHPIGALGTVSFGVEGKRSSTYALLRRFEDNERADAVIQSVVGSWRLPRHVATAKDLAPGTWILAEVDGSLALRLAAELGYDFNYVHEVTMPGLEGGTGLTGDLGLKIETGLKAALGFSVSGRYLIVVGRESAEPAIEDIRLRLFKQTKKGFNFGLNLATSLQGIDTLTPDSVDDLVKAIFGVHGLQIIKDLQAIEKWTDPSQKLSDLVAGLVNEKGLELIRETTGLDPTTAFDEARNVLLRALRSWNLLPDRVSSNLWTSLGNMDNKAIKAFREGLQALVTGSSDERLGALVRLISSTALESQPIGQWVSALAGRGLLALIDQPAEVAEAANATLAVLGGDVFKNLRKFLDDRLNLDRIEKAASQTDFNRLDSFLVGRLSRFLDERLEFHNLDRIREALHHALRLRQELYQKARQAMTRQYDFNLAYAYQKATAQTALIDVVFDFKQAAARELFQRVAAQSQLNDLLTVETDGVRLNQAVLSHQIDRKSSLQVNLPKFDLTKEALGRSLAKVTAVDEGGRLLVYELDSEDVVQVKNRLRSQLNVALSLAIAPKSRVRVHSHDSMTVAYQFVHAQENMRLAELKHLTQPFITKYLPELFQQAGSSSLETWYLDLDRAVEDAVGNGTNEFGDVLTSLEVTIPGSALAAWLFHRSELQRKVLAKEVSKSVQAALKGLIPAYYFQDLGRLHSNAAAAALLVWASLPACTSARIHGDRLILNELEEDSVYWDFADFSLRTRMVTSSAATGSLSAQLLAARERLLASDRDEDRKRAGFFVSNQTGSFQQMALAGGHGESLLGSLLFTEAEVVRGAAEALKDVNEFLEASSQQPQRAIERLAEFGAGITETFHRRLANVYGNEAMRALGAVVFLEAARVLDLSLISLRPNAMLSLTVLKEQRRFNLPDYLLGKQPEEADVALKQRLVSAAAG